MPFHGLKPEFYALAAGTKSDKEVRIQFPDSSQINTVYGEISDRFGRTNDNSWKFKIDYDELIIGLGLRINISMSWC